MVGGKEFTCHYSANATSPATSMSPLQHTILTVALLVALGWALTRWAIVKPEQWNGFEHISYQVFFPALVLNALITADLSAVPSVAFGIATVGTVLVGAMLLVLLNGPIQRWTGSDGPAFTSIFQGAIRWNTFMAFALVDGLYGKRGLALIAITIALIIPIINVSSVWVLQRFAHGSGGLSLGLLIRNPFIWSSLMGLALNLSGIELPRSVIDATGIAGKAALAGALLLVGSGLKLGDLGRPTRALVLASGIRLLLMPLLAFALAVLIGIKGADLGVLIICAAVPTASASYILARQMGGDARLMAAITTFQTLASLLTLPLMLTLLVR
jgi:predicted permease